MRRFYRAAPFPLLSVLLAAFLTFSACTTLRLEPKERADFQKAALDAAQDEQISRARAVGQKTPADLSVLLAYGRLLATVSSYEALEQLARNLNEHKLCHKDLDERQVEKESDRIQDLLDALDLVARAQSGFQGWLGSYPSSREEVALVLAKIEQSLVGADLAYEKNCHWKDLRAIGDSLGAYLATENGKTLKPDTAKKKPVSPEPDKSAHALLSSILCRFHGCDPGSDWTSALK